MQPKELKANDNTKLPAKKTPHTIARSKSPKFGFAEGLKVREFWISQVKRDNK